MTDTMNALVSGRGNYWEFKKVAVPTPAPGQILIHTEAVATNNADIPMLDEADPTRGGHGNEFVAGFEYAGTVAAVGIQVDSWTVGDAVMGSMSYSFAEYVVADARHVLPRPPSLECAAACALPTGLLTEHGALSKAHFSAGLSVLIAGASTAIGLIGVQVAKALGASLVVGTTRSPDKRALLSEAGVDTVVVAGEDDLVSTTRAATGGSGVDIVLDHLAGQTLAQCLEATREGGNIVNIGRLAGAESVIDADRLSYGHLTLHGVSFGFGRPEEMASIIAGLHPHVLPAVARGAIRPVIDRVVPWTEHSTVVDHLRGGGVRGKVVMTLND